MTKGSDAPDTNRGDIIEALIVLPYGADATKETVKAFQDHVKSTIAPFKYPHLMVFTKGLPKNGNGQNSTR